MSTDDELKFLDGGPFDEEEQATIRRVYEAIRAGQGTEELLSSVRRNVARLDKFGQVLLGFPSLFERQSLGSRRRDVASLVDLLSRSDLSNFEMFLPTRALLGRDLIMAEMNFYRLLRFVCGDALGPEAAAEHLVEIERHLVHCIYTRLAGDVLTGIATDATTASGERKKAVLSLLHIYERAVFRIADFLPVLQATWEARRRISVAGGTMLGTSEMFQLLQSGCDERFVQLLVHPEHTEDEAAAFREFLFGATTEAIERIEHSLAASGGTSISIGDLSSLSCSPEVAARTADPALAMFEFFLKRHLQAAARRLGDLPGPKRTAEEYVMLHYLESQEERELSSMPPPRRLE